MGEPTMKRLNRQSSSGRRNTSISSIEEITEKDMNHLNVSLKRSTLVASDKEESPRKPSSLKVEDRVSTLDKFIVDMDPPNISPSRSYKPRPLDLGDRMSTVDQINLLVKDIDDPTSYPIDDVSSSFQESEGDSNINGV